MASMLFILIPDELKKFEVSHCYSSSDELEKEKEKRGGGRVPNARVFLKNFIVIL